LDQRFRGPPEISSPRAIGTIEKSLAARREPTLVWTVWGGASLPARDESPAAVDRRCPRTRHRCLGRHVTGGGSGTDEHVRPVAGLWLFWRSSP